MIAAVKVESTALDSMREKLREVDNLRNQLSAFTKRIIDADQANLNLKANLVKQQEQYNELKKQKAEVESSIVPLRQELNRTKDALTKERSARQQLQQELSTLREQYSRLEVLRDNLDREVKTIPTITESNEILKNDLQILRRRYKEEKANMTKHIKFLESQNRDLDVLRNEIRNMAMRLMDLSSGNNGANNGNAANPQNSPIHPPQQQQQMAMYPGQPHPGMMHHPIGGAPPGMGMPMPGYSMPPQQQHQPLHRPHHSMDFEEDAVLGGAGSADEDELDDDDEDDLMHTPGHNNSHYHQQHQQQMNLHQMQLRQQGNKGGSNIYYENDFDSVHSGAAYSVNSSIESLPMSVAHGNANNNNTNSQSQKMGTSTSTTGGGGSKKKKVKKSVVTSATRYTNENNANSGAVGGASVTLPRI
jgi:hypothetical protein